MFTLSPLTTAVLDTLRGANRDVSYDQLCTATGCSKDDLRRPLRTARIILERDEGIVFATVPRSGLRRLSDSEIVASSRDFTRKIHRTAIQGETRLGAVRDMAALSEQDQLAATIQQTVFRAIQREARKTEE